MWHWLCDRCQVEIFWTLQASALFYGLAKCLAQSSSAVWPGSQITCLDVLDIKNSDKYWPLIGIGCFLLLFAKNLQGTDKFRLKIDSWEAIMEGNFILQRAGLSVRSIKFRLTSAIPGPPNEATLSKAISLGGDTFVIQQSFLCVWVYLFVYSRLWERWSRRKWRTRSWGKGMEGREERRQDSKGQSSVRR